MECTLEPMEVHVRQQGRNHPPLRCAFFGSLAVLFAMFIDFHDFAAQPHL